MFHTIRHHQVSPPTIISIIHPLCVRVSVENYELNTNEIFYFGQQHEQSFGDVSCKYNTYTRFRQIKAK